MTQQARTMEQLIKENDKLKKALLKEKKEHRKTLNELIALMEKEQQEEQKQQEEQEPKNEGRLAKVSIYEFVNDWIRPEISWKIFSYLAEDPHKEGVEEAQHRRRIFHKSQFYLPTLAPNPNYKKGKGFWLNGRDADENGLYYFDEKPYKTLKIYKRINTPYNNHHDGFCAWMRNYNSKTYGYKLKYTNPLLVELWRFHESYTTRNNTKRFVVTKQEIKEYLKINKVKGRSDLTFGVKCSDGWGSLNFIRVGEDIIPPEQRRELVGALMKI